MATLMLRKEENGEKRGLRTRKGQKANRVGFGGQDAAPQVDKGRKESLARKTVGRREKKGQSAGARKTNHDESARYMVKGDGGRMAKGVKYQDVPGYSRGASSRNENVSGSGPSDRRNGPLRKKSRPRLHELDEP